MAPQVGFEPTTVRLTAKCSPTELHPPFKDLEAATGFEPVIKVLQTSALPLGYAALTGLEGFEPSHDGIKIRCLTAWL